MRSAWMIAFWLTSAGAANAAESVATKFDTDRCKVVAMETEDEAGVPLKKSEHYASAWRCRGLGDLYIYVRYGDQREDIAFGTLRGETTAYMGHGHFGSWGPSVEWRGAKTKDGRFMPTAAIVPYRWDIRIGETGRKEIGGDLAIIKLGKTQRETCVVAWVDTVANSAAMKLARTAADEQAASHVCSNPQQRQYIGNKSRLDRN